VGTARDRRHIAVARTVNGVGAAATCLVLVIVVATKVPHG